VERVLAAVALEVTQCGSGTWAEGEHAKRPAWCGGDNGMEDEQSRRRRHAAEGSSYVPWFAECTSELPEHFVSSPGDLLTAGVQNETCNVAPAVG